MPRMVTVRVLYHEYTIDPQDVGVLLQIASRMTRLKRDSYKGPYVISDNQESWLDNISFNDVDLVAAINPDPVGNAPEAIGHASETAPEF